MMAEELERDLFDDLLKKSGDNLLGKPKKGWPHDEIESEKPENDSSENINPKEKIKKDLSKE